MPMDLGGFGGGLPEEEEDVDSLYMRNQYYYPPAQQTQTTPVYNQPVVALTGAGAAQPSQPNQSVGENVMTGGQHLTYQQEPTPTYQDLMETFQEISSLYEQQSGQQVPQNLPEQFQMTGTLQSPLEEQPHEGIYPEWVPDWIEEGLELLGAGAMMSGMTTGSTGPGTTMGNEPITSHNLTNIAQINEPNDFRMPNEGPFGLPGDVGHGWQGIHNAPSAHGLLVDFLNQLSFQRAMEDYYQPLTYWGGGQPALPIYSGGGGGGGYTPPPNNPYWWMNLVRWNI